VPGRRPLGREYRRTAAVRRGHDRDDHLRAAVDDAKSSLAEWDDADRYEADEGTGDLRYFG
jgi:hypothetical protein